MKSRPTFAVHEGSPYTHAMRLPYIVAGALALAATAGCSDIVSVTFAAPADFQLDSSEVELPEELNDDGQVAEVPCGPMGSCPSSDGDVSVTCEDDVCDPAPTTVVVPAGDVVDFDMLSTELSELFTEVEEIEILEATYAIERNTLSFDLQPIEVHWGPEGATTINPDMGTMRLGTVPPIAAGEAPSGGVTLDAAGQRALSDHLVSASRRVRFFSRTEVDLDPRDPWPTGGITGKVELRIRAQGSAL